MTRWTHTICDKCWTIHAPGQVAYRVGGKGRQEEVCCYCFEFTMSGIYRRDDPSELPCRGNHGESS